MKQKKQRSKLRIVLYVLGGLLAAILLGLLAVYLAVQHEPDFYCQAMAIKRDTLEKGSDQMLQQVAALQGAANRRGKWQSVITAEEINGWLAVDLAKNHPGALPSSVSDPRIVIRPKELIVACRYKQSGINSVLSLTVEPYLSETNTIVVRIARIRAGVMPIPLEPLEKAVQQISVSASDTPWRITQGIEGGDPVVIFSYVEDPNARRVVRIESVELVDGAIHIGGSSQRREKAAKK